SNIVQGGSTVNKLISLSAKADGYYDNGQIIFTSGANNGLVKAIKSYFDEQFLFNSPFLRLDNAVFVWEADPTLVGTTIYFKFTSFNTFGLMEQSLANAAPHSFAFNGIFGNNDETPANNATIDSVFISGTADSIRVYGPGGVGS